MEDNKKHDLNEYDETELKDDTLTSESYSEEDNTRGSESIDDENVDYVLVDSYDEEANEADFQKPQPSQVEVSEKRKNSKPMVRFIAGILILALVGGFSAGVGYRTVDYYFFNPPEQSVKYSPNLEQVSFKPSENATTVTEIANLVEPSVVAITNQVVQESFFGLQRGTSAGSGVIFDISNEKIYIMTNHHVIDSSEELMVNFYGDHIYNAAIEGSDEETDLAVISVNIQDIDQTVLNTLTAIQLGDSDNLQVGEIAIAIGNPLGYNNTVTTGIISALDREISDAINPLSLIQTDAAINPGNSGGALVNQHGELIGINTSKIAETNVEGIGFAIPINAALPILKQITEKGYVDKPFIGLSGVNITEEVATMYSVPIGVHVQNTFKDSPAEKGGLLRADIITHVDDVEIQTMSDLNSIIRSHEVGDVVILTIERNNSDGNKRSLETMKLEITIGNRQDIINNSRN